MCNYCVIIQNLKYYHFGVSNSPEASAVIIPHYASAAQLFHLHIVPNFEDMIRQASSNLQLETILNMNVVLF